MGRRMPRWGIMIWESRARILTGDARSSITALWMWRERVIRRRLLIGMRMCMEARAAAEAGVETFLTAANCRSLRRVMDCSLQGCGELMWRVWFREKMGMGKLFCLRAMRRWRGMMRAAMNRRGVVEAR